MRYRELTVVIKKGINIIMKLYLICKTTPSFNHVINEMGTVCAIGTSIKEILKCLVYLTY